MNLRPCAASQEKIACSPSALQARAGSATAAAVMVASTTANTRAGNGMREIIFVAPSLVSRGQLEAEHIRNTLDFACASSLVLEAQAEAADEMAFRTLAPDAPIAEWLRFTHYSQPPSRRAAAAAVIAQRPNVVAEMS